MSRSKERESWDESGVELDSAQFTQLLLLGVQAPRRPVDDVIDRLEAPDGHTWFLAMTRDMGAHFSSPDARTPLTVDELLAMKDEAKRRFSAATTVDEVVRTVTSYFLILALGILRFRKILTSQPESELQTALADLAAAAPEPWSSGLVEAAAQVG